MAQRIYRRREVESVTGLSRSTIYDLMSKGLFPRPVKLTGKAVGWPEKAVTQWLNSREQTAA
ncbi:MAG TPA: AlpA family transcriptional regulator [Alicycliphilus sp.]|nr:AlpA family transcriptional regulator [Alicycliphilus sp.]